MNYCANKLHYKTQKHRLFLKKTFKNQCIESFNIFCLNPLHELHFGEHCTRFQFNLKVDGTAINLLNQGISHCFLEYFGVPWWCLGRLTALVGQSCRNLALSLMPFLFCCFVWWCLLRTYVGVGVSKSLFCILNFSTTHTDYWKPKSSACVCIVCIDCMKPMEEILSLLS
jgi:hypothetical protein